MKRIHILYILLLNLGGMSAAAQVRPFVEEGKTWTIELRGSHVASDPSQPSLFQQYVLEGDTVIAGRTWKKLYFVWDYIGEKSLASAFYEEDHRVYFLPYHGATEGKLIYDFNPTEQDTYTFFRPEDTWYMAENEEKYKEKVSSGMKMLGTEQIEMPGQALRLYKFTQDGDISEGNNSSAFSYVEGVGFLQSPLWYSSTTLGYSLHVVECSVAGEKLYEAELWWEQPNGISSAPTEEAGTADGPVFDLSGRRLNGIPKSGVYIRNGRKYLAR